MYDGGPAFPCGPVGGFGPAEGMSLRDYFAGQALATVACAVIAEPTDGSKLTEQMLATTAYKLADAMLQARKGGEP